ncbi:MAG TPA: N-acyl homoserine lactonase family protein, partial [Chloroflexota bacterium]|nr:N-acyl homoserine lactonase family protein [Chloroflexota bacterium]
ASHYYANIEQDRPFSVVTDLPAMYRAFDTLRSPAGGLERLIPGHDPLVLRRFPAAAPDLDGIAARIA